MAGLGEVEQKSNPRQGSGTYLPFLQLTLSCESPETAPRGPPESDVILIETQSQLYGHLTAENWHFT